MAPSSKPTARDEGKQELKEKQGGQPPPGHRSGKRNTKIKSVRNSQLKVIHSNTKKGILIEFLLFHFLLVFLVLVFFALHLSNVYWHPPSPSSNVLSALQFVAKAHEALIVTTISTILLDHIRYRLFASTSPGIPLGLVTAPFRLSSAAPTYLASSEFFSTLREWRRLMARDVVTAVLIVYLFIIVLLASPSAAITILPNLSTLPYPESFQTIQSETRGREGVYLDFYKACHFADLYPTLLNASFLEGGNCPTAQPGCPINAIPEVLKQFYEVFLTNLVDFGTSYNFTVRAEQTIRSRLLESSKSFGLNDGGPDSAAEKYYVEVAYATTSPRSLSVNMGLLTELVGRWLRSNGRNWPVRITSTAGDSTGTSLWKQPFVTTHCSHRDSPLEFSKCNGTITDATRFGFPASDNSTISVTVAADTLPCPALNASSAIIIPRTSLSSSPAIEISSALAFETSNNATTLCIISAQWLEAAETFKKPLQPGNVPDFALAEPNLDLHYHGGDSNSSIGSAGSGITGGRGGGGGGQVLTLTQDWLEAFDQCQQPSSPGYFANLTTICGASGGARPNPDAACLAAGLSTGVAEGLSQAMDAHATYYLGSTDDEDRAGRHPGKRTLYRLRSNADLANLEPFVEVDTGTTSDGNSGAAAVRLLLPKYTQMQFAITHDVYAYTFSSGRGAAGGGGGGGGGNVTVYLAFTVLFLYVATAAAHVLLLLVGRTWTSTAWSSPGELLVFAMRGVGDGSAGMGMGMGMGWTLRAVVDEVDPGECEGGSSGPGAVCAGFVVRRDRSRRKKKRASRKQDQPTKMKRLYTYAYCYF
ncbi:hypothetical protein B0T26DRAFT_678793 [Lasiosphaeria miniovina]|uniref:Uncharacterized protein n=1 Tax=Lasiosphaeria miniovina TaxID=1954250 RepID=A0AA40A565_9PEZI|nr:uncharacterized protein B0T26DRAFT_678793 [Lasiosphaeria miniovina]KAK0709363.1 hypothetical protein B0T26DRAFT_678793 [Lasiosphaeria miniovina]